MADHNPLDAACRARRALHVHVAACPTAAVDTEHTVYAAAARYTIYDISRPVAEGDLLFTVAAPRPRERAIAIARAVCWIAEAAAGAGEIVIWCEDTSVAAVLRGERAATTDPLPAGLSARLFTALKEVPCLIDAERVGTAPAPRMRDLKQQLRSDLETLAGGATVIRLGAVDR